MIVFEIILNLSPPLLWLPWNSFQSSASWWTLQWRWRLSFLTEAFSKPEVQPLSRTLDRRSPEVLYNLNFPWFYDFMEHLIAGGCKRNWKSVICSQQFQDSLSMQLPWLTSPVHINILNLKKPQKISLPLEYNRCMMFHTVSNNPHNFFSRVMQACILNCLMAWGLISAQLKQLPFICRTQKAFSFFFSCKSRCIKIWQPVFHNICLQLALFPQADADFKAAVQTGRPQLSYFPQHHFRWCSHQKVPWILHSALTLLFGTSKQTVF